MKKNTHPKYYQNAQVTCACGNTFKVSSSKKTLSIDVCSKCHPFFTGSMRFADIKGNIDRFLKKQKIAAIHKKQQKKKIAKKKKRLEHKSLKEMLTVTKLDK